jgi:hypothetical protein
LLDRARAIAIQARMLVTWDTGADGRGRGEAAARSPGHRVERKPERAVAEAPDPHGETGQAVVEREPGASPVVDGERPSAAPPSAGADHGGDETKAAGDRPATRVERKPVTPEQTATASAPSSPSPVYGPGVAKAWPWIPTVLGGSAAVAAGLCALVARDRYNALADKSQPYASAVVLKEEGENWQTASYVLVGVAVVGLATGIVGFATRPAVTPVPGGAMVSLTGALP